MPSPKGWLLPRAEVAKDTTYFLPHPQLHLGIFIKVNGSFPGLVAEQERQVWRLELKAVQRVNSTTLPGGQSRKNSHRYTNPLDFTVGMKSRAAKFGRNLSPLLIALSLIISQNSSFPNSQIHWNLPAPRPCSVPVSRQ